MSWYLWVFIGYIYAVFIGHFFTKAIIELLWKDINRKIQRPIKRVPYHPEIIGYVERFLFITAFVLGKAEFVGIWLALKVAGQWKYWSDNVVVKNGCEKGNNEDNHIPGRTFYNIFLIGSASSITFSATGWKILQWGATGRWGDALTVGTTLILLSIALYIKIFRNYFHNKKGRRTTIVILWKLCQYKRQLITGYLLEQFHSLLTKFGKSRSKVISANVQNLPTTSDSSHP